MIHVLRFLDGLFPFDPSTDQLQVFSETIQEVETVGLAMVRLTGDPWVTVTRAASRSTCEAILAAIFDAVTHDQRCVDLTTLEAPVSLPNTAHQATQPPELELLWGR